MLETMKSYKPKPSPPQNTLTKQNAAETILSLGLFPLIIWKIPLPERICKKQKTSEVVG